jgi:hypothetical protein
MNAYFAAIDIGVFRADNQWLPKPKDPNNLISDDVYYKKWNANTKNMIFRSLCKDNFSGVHNHKDACALWSDI